ncbi:MAG: HEAT repeat domain-containing protein [Candidatus Poribacteria bacterium]|nr:HEAT repeat domain-containing protein [Candidatus Poribacteria bacterium]
MNPLIIPIFGLLARQAVIFLTQSLVLRLGFPPHRAKQIDQAFGSLFGFLVIAIIWELSGPLSLGPLNDFWVRISLTLITILFFIFVFLTQDFLPQRRLIQHLNHPQADSQLIHQSAKTLAGLGPRFLDRIDPINKAKLAQQLGLMESEAKLVIPILIHLLDDPDSQVRLQTDQSLQQITSEKVILDLAQLLKRKSLRLRNQVVKQLGQIGPAAKPALPALVLLLKDQRVTISVRQAIRKISTNLVDDLTQLSEAEESEIRIQAPSALGQIGAEAKPAIHRLIDTLGDDIPEVRSNSAKALGQIGYASPEVVLALRLLIGDSSWQARANAISALGEFGVLARQALGDLSQALSDETDQWVRESIEDAIEKIKFGSQYLKAKIIEMETEVYTDYTHESKVFERHTKFIYAILCHDKKIRELTFDTYQSQSNPEWPMGLEGAVRLRDGSFMTAFLPSYALPQQAKQQLKDQTNFRQSVPMLVRLLADQNSVIRRRAIKSLGLIGPEVKDAVPELTQMLRCVEKEIRDSAFQALAAIGSEAKQAVPALIQALKDQDSDIRINAISTLREIGPAARQAVPFLIQALEDQDEVVRIDAAEILEEIGAEAKQAVPFLIQALEDQNSYVRSQAVKTLGTIGAKAKSSVPALIQALEDQDEIVRRDAEMALRELGSESVPDLIQALKDQDEVVRRNAKRILIEMGSEPVPGLIQALKDQDEVVRRDAAEILEEIGAEAKQAVPALIQLLDDESLVVRVNAIEALGDIGAEAKQAVPMLTQALEDKFSAIRDSAEVALRQISSEDKK